MAYVGDCIVFMFGAGIAPNTLTGVINSATQAVFDGDIDQNGFGLVISITVPDATTLSIPWSGTMTTSPSDEQSNLYVCSCSTGEFVDDDNNMGTSGTLTAGPLAAGTYYLFMIFSGTASPPFNTIATYTVNVDTSMVVNPVIARWDDSGTTRILEACPKMIIPAPEWDGAWYADETAAQDAIDTLAVDCFAFSPKDVFSFVDSESFSGTTYSGSNSISEEPVAFGYVWFSVNLVGGDTVTIQCDITGSGTSGCDPGNPSDCSLAEAEITLYAPDGTVILSASDSNPGGLTASASDSITVPYSGKYIARALAQAGSWDTASQSGGSGSASVTSDGDISANPIQALYATDPLLGCPARLDC